MFTVEGDLLGRVRVHQLWVGVNKGCFTNVTKRGEKNYSMRFCGHSQWSEATITINPTIILLTPWVMGHNVKWTQINMCLFLNNNNFKFIFSKRRW